LVCAAQEVMAANADFAVRTLAARATTPSGAGAQRKRVDY
jgi:hypothetical protein